MKNNMSVGIAIAVGVLIGAFAIYTMQPRPERFVQVNAFGEWRGFEITGENVRWVLSCSPGSALQWKSKSERVADSLRNFHRQSPFILDHPSMGAFAKVDDFSQPQIDMAIANMRILLKQWSAEQVPGEKITGCASLRNPTTTTTSPPSRWT